MTVNAFSQDSLQANNQQDAVSLVDMHPDGRVTLHPALVEQLAPNLLARFLNNPSVSNPDNVEAFPSVKNQTHKPACKHADHYEMTRKSNYRQGRIWASYLRRKVRDTDCSRYEGMQSIASDLGLPVTDIRCLIELHNKAMRARAKSMRQNLVWKKYLSGFTHKEIALAFQIHPKTVAADIKCMKELQL